MKLTLRLLAPYFAVVVFWCIFSNAWLAILAYHVQILLWTRGPFRAMRKERCKHLTLLALPAALAGPLLYWLLPHMTHADLASWLAQRGLSDCSLLVMIPYFGIVHPLLEERHWAPLRKRTPLAHPVFAGYHMPVLHSLLTFPWLALCFAVLTAASLIWHKMAQRPGGPPAAVASHILADLGIVLAAWLKA
jgi:hypothetical protein